MASVNTPSQNALAMIDAILDYYDKVANFTAGDKANIVEEFINEIGGARTNDEKGATFIEMLANIIKSTAKAHARIKSEQEQQATIDAAEAAAKGAGL